MILNLWVILDDVVILSKDYLQNAHQKVAREDLKALLKVGRTSFDSMTGVRGVCRSSKSVIILSDMFTEVGVVRWCP